MNLLLDTHALIWFLDGNDKDLSQRAKSLILDSANKSFVSIARLWEMAIKIRLGGLTFEKSGRRFGFYYCRQEYSFVRH